MADAQHHCPWRFCSAPMIDWSDRHCRFMWRMLSRRVRLYTPMITTGAILHGDVEYLLRYDPQEHPLALQLGGADPTALAQCASIAEQWGYDEINLNCGCPSDRVQSGLFGACLMAKPELVAEAVAAMIDACAIPVTVKHRIGIDDRESYALLCDFVDRVAEAGCKVFIVHARKAWLQGLSPKENREIPPLNYPWVYQLKKDFPELRIVINGGIDSFAKCNEHLQQVDGVMLGRAVYKNPWLMADVDRQLFDKANPVADRSELFTKLLPYVERELGSGVKLNHITRHLLGLYQGVAGAKQFRRHLSENAWREGAGVEVLEQALAFVR
ncbi:MAG: tRNA dihydrouridine(20/20a) synthase DusA [Gammaproteobacteria bacterium]|nr:MAG: tRNA dihydrouridine(20/20a) synthase DusA [Gammaproteobacteria bacterium]